MCIYLQVTYYWFLQFVPFPISPFVKMLNKQKPHLIWFIVIHFRLLARLINGPELWVMFHLAIPTIGIQELEARMIDNLTNFVATDI